MSTKISDLTSATEPFGNSDYFPLVQSSATKKATFNSVSRVVVETAGATSSYWAKILTLTNTSGTTNLASLNFSIDAAIGSSAKSAHAEITLDLRDEVALGLHPTWSFIKVLNTADIFAPDAFKVIQSTAALGNAIEVWVKYGTVTGRKVTVTEDSKSFFNTGWDITYNPGATWQAADPGVGAAVEIVSDWAGREVYSPELYGASTIGVGTYSIQEGAYTRHNGRVTGSGRLTWSAHTGTGTMRITLPSIVAAGYAQFSPQLMWCNGVQIGTGKIPSLLAASNSAYGEIYAIDPVTGTATVAMDTIGDVIFYFDYEEA